MKNPWTPLGIESLLSPDYSFNNFDAVATTDLYGLIKQGGSLNSDWVLEAYSKGIFPWYEDRPIKWYSPPRRLVLFPQDFKVSRSFSKFLESHSYRVACDTDFLGVITSCASSRRKYLEGYGKYEPLTWINQDIIKVYQELHNLGVAHSVEVWREDTLVGGLYGLSLGRMFFGESMFYQERDCSKLALYALCQFLQEREFTAIDCQIYSEHLESLGAVNVFKKKFLELLVASHQFPSLIGSWNSWVN